MRRTVRLLTGGALALAAASLTVAVPAVPAWARDTGTAGGTLELDPSSVEPGAAVTVRTSACGGQRATGNADAVGAGRFALAATAGRTDAVGSFEVPPGAQLGTYEIIAQCSGGGPRATGDLVVALAAPTGLLGEPLGGELPRGSVETGAGGAMDRPGPARTAAGLTALVVAVASGTWFLRRRARGDGT